MIDPEDIKDQVVKEYNAKSFNNVIKTYEQNSVILHREYKLIGLIAFSYQETKDYKGALRIIDSNLAVAHFNKMSSSDIDLLFLVGINSSIELGLTKKAFRLSLKYFILNGENKELAIAYYKLKEKMINRALKILTKIVMIGFFGMYLINMILEYLYSCKLVPSYISLPLVLLFCLYIYLFYYSNFFNKIITSYYDKNDCYLPPNSSPSSK